MTREGAENAKGSREGVCSYTQNECKNSHFPMLRMRLLVQEQESLLFCSVISAKN